MSHTAPISRSTTPLLNGRDSSVQVGECIGDFQFLVACSLSTAVRVRPVTQSDLASLPSRFQRTVVTTPKNTPSNVNVLPTSTQGSAKPQIFQFDHVFGADAGQTDVYDAVVEGLVHRFLEGAHTALGFIMLNANS